MQPEERNAKCLWDMQEACRSIGEFIAGMDLGRFASDKRTRSAVERMLEIIGEAARRISVDFTDAHPEVPWRAIVGVRNLLAHDYGEVDVDRVFHMANEKVPELLSQLEQLLRDRTP